MGPIDMRVTKPRPNLYSVELSCFQRAIDWVREWTERDVRSAVLDPYTERWSFYDASGALLFVLPHDLIDRIDDAIRVRSSATVYARESSRHSQALGGRDPGDETAGTDGWFNNWTQG